MNFRLGSFALLVAAVLLSDILGNMIGNFFEALFKAGVLAVLIWLVNSRGNDSQPAHKPSSNRLRALFMGSTEQAIDHETRAPSELGAEPADPAKRRPY